MKNLIFKTDRLELEQAWIDHQIEELKAKREATCWETYKKERKERNEAWLIFEGKTKANWK